MYPMSYGNPYGQNMADGEYGNRMGFGLHPAFAFMAQNGGGLPPMYQPAPHTGGPLMPQQQGNGGIMPPNILAGGGLPPQQMPVARAGGPGQMMQQAPNRLGGFGGGYNNGLGGYLR